MTEETKILRFIDPISKDNVSLRIKKNLIKKEGIGPSTITYLYRDHALILYIDANFEVRTVKASTFVDNQESKSEEFNLEDLQVEEEDVLESKEVIEEPEEISKDKILESIKEELKDCELSNKLNFIIVGPPRVGKTSLIYRYLYDFYKKSYVISTDVKKFKHDVETLVGKKLDIIFWDIPGQINPSVLKKELIKHVHGIICLFDVTNKESFKDLKEKWIPFLQNLSSSYEIIYIANKIDQDNEREVFENEINQLSKKKDINIFKSSVSTKINLDGPINDLIFSVYLKQK
ncbi:MAG: GTP-binding protein [Promethearchaeia archaeon]